jgi:hypothetical protein
VSRPKTKDARLNIRLPADVHAWARGYAEKQIPKTTITEILTKHLQELREKEQSNAQPTGK